MSKRAATKSKTDAGRYIALNPSTGKKVIASGSNPATVIKKARGQGVDVPTIIFVPNKDTSFLY